MLGRLRISLLVITVALAAVEGVWQTLTNSSSVVNASMTTGPGKCRAFGGVAVTFYGAPDNDPPGSPVTAWGCDSSRGARAGGSGSFLDPLSFASAKNEFEKCEIIYLPYLKKYLRFDDLCATCGRSSWRLCWAACG